MRDKDHILLENLYQEVLNEAIPLSIAKKAFGRKHFEKNYKDFFLNRVFEEWYSAKDRIILPFVQKKDFYINLLHDEDTSAYTEIRNYIRGWTSQKRKSPYDDFKDELEKMYKEKIHETDPERFNKLNNEAMKAQWLETFDLDENDYVEGYAYRPFRKENGMIEYGTKDPKQKVRIGKLLQQYGRDDLLKKFKEDPARKLVGEYVIVISRHPYDIAGISTDRNWTSCLDRKYPPIVYKDKKEKEKDFDQLYYQKNEIKKWGQSEADREKCHEDLDGLVAYLVPKSEVYGKEKVSLKKPIARIVMYRSSDQTHYYIPEDGIKGVYSEEFEKQVRHWMDENFLSKGSDGEEDTYYDYEDRDR